MNANAIASLRKHLDTLNCGHGQLLQSDALRYLETQTPTAFDLVFLDPPFNKNLLQPACELLETKGWLAEHAWVYTESEALPSSLGLPGNWRLHREKQAGRCTTRSGSATHPPLEVGDFSRSRRSDRCDRRPESGRRCRSRWR